MLKELVTIGDVTLRRGLLAVAFRDALAMNNNPDASATRGGLAPKPTRPPSSQGRWGAGGAGSGGSSGGNASDAPQLLRNAKAGAPDDPSAPPPVRPGRFLDCVANLQADIATAEGVRSAEELEKDAIWRRLRDCRGDALFVLEDMAHWQ